MDRGTTVRDVLWQSPDGKELRIRITRMASFHQLPLFTIDYELTPLNFSDELIIESTHNGYVTNYV
jgi:alpha,alpha-trehalose phosphorylase